MVSLTPSGRTLSSISEFSVHLAMVAYFLGDGGGSTILEVR